MKPFLAVLLLAVFTTPATHALVFSQTDLNSTLVVFDSTTLQPIGAPAASTAVTTYDLAWDNGRLFGIGNSVLVEFDPFTGAVINSQSYAGSINGLAAVGGRLYSMTSSDTLVIYDQSTLLPIGSAAQSSSMTHYDLAFSDSGRLFGLGTNSLIEFDPVTGVALNSTVYSGSITGLAARGNVVYALTGSSPTLVRYDANSLLPLGAAAAGTTVFTYDLAFDETGRLFGIVDNQLLEFDPATGSILNAAAFTGSVDGLAATAIPEPTVLFYFAAGGFVLTASRRKGHRAPP